MAKDFASAAERFCSIIEEDSPSSVLSWLSRLHKALADLYAAAAALPEVDPATDRAVPRMSTDEWSSIFETIRARLGESDSYWQVFDPFDRASMVEASIADDLTGVYQDVRGGLVAARSGAPPEDVLFEWQTGFDIHWGKHAVNALTAIGELIASGTGRK